MSVATPTILSAGQKMDPTYEIIAIDIYREVNRIPYAQLILIDGDPAQQRFAISNTAFFEPGKKVEIKVRYEEKPDQEAKLFEGVVVGQRVEADLRGCFLTVELKDAAFKLTAPRRSTVYRNQSDDQVISEIISGRGLRAGKIATTQGQHAELVQFYCSDWDFICTRASSNGLLAVVNNGEISLAEITLSGAAKQTFEVGIDEIYNFEIEADGGYQLPAVESVAWDMKNHKMTKATKAKEVAVAPGNLDGAKIATTLGMETQTLVSAIPLSPEELQSWSNSTLSHNRMALIRGRICVPGLGKIQLLDSIELLGVGKRFNGTTLVTAIRHRLDHQGWQTDLQFGLSPHRFGEQGTTGVVDLPAAGLLPGVNGLQIGVVDKFQEDPNQEFRVKVILPSIDENEGSLWARLASPEAGNGRGYIFRPEAGDEVIIGFLNDDPRQPVILGALFSSKNRPPAAVAAMSEKNPAKAIITKSGTSIRFLDETKASLQIQTPDKNSITLDDDGKKIEINDQHGNVFVMDKSGVVIKSTNKLTLEATGNVEIKGAKVELK